MPHNYMMEVFLYLFFNNLEFMLVLVKFSVLTKLFKNNMNSVNDNEYYIENNETFKSVIVNDKGYEGFKSVR